MAACGWLLPAWLPRTLSCGEVQFCVRVLGHGFRAYGTPISSFQHGRSVHSSPALPAKSYLHKFKSKSKQKLWYDSPRQVPAPNKPPGLMTLMKPQQKENRGNNVRVKMFNSILFEALTGLLSTSEVSDEVYDLHIELSKVSVPADFSVCRAFWLSSRNKDTDAQIGRVLQTYASHFRHILISRHVLGNVPPVVFVRDKEDSKIQEVEELFSLLKSENSNDSSVIEDRISRDFDLESQTEASAFQSLGILGIDHAELNRQIFEYKKKTKDKSVEPDNCDLLQQQELQLAEIRKHNLMRKKMKKQKKSADNISPQDYFLATDMDSEEQEDFELQEDFVEEEEEEDDGRTLK